MPVSSNPIELPQNGVFSLAPQKKKYQLLLQKMRQALCQGNFDEYLKYLYRLGSDLQRYWEVEGRNNKTGKKEFRQYIQNEILAYSDDTVLKLSELCDSASNLEMVLTVWEDPALSRSQEEKKEKTEASSEVAQKVKIPKVERQKYKIKREIDIVNRHAIHTGLLAACFDLINQYESLLKRTKNCTQESDYLDSIKSDLKTLINSEINPDSKLDNQGLIKLLKRIRSLNVAREIPEKNVVQGIQRILENKEDSEQKKRENKVLFEKNLDSINKDRMHNEELLKEILDSSRWRGNGVFLETITNKIIKCNKDNELLKDYSNKKVGNEELLKKLKQHVREQENYNEKLLKKIIRYINKKEEINKKLLKKIAECKSKNEKHSQKLLKKINKKNQTKTSDCITKNRKDNKELEGIIVRINKDKNDNQELLLKIYQESKDKERIEKLLKKHYQLTKNQLKQNLLESFSKKNSEVFLAEIESAVKLKKVTIALTSFKIFSDKVFSTLGVFIALLASLACGFVTAGCIFLLLAGVSTFLPVLPIITLVAFIAVSLLVFIAGFHANFRFFAETLPKCLGMFTKSGGVTEFIDRNGKRAQLSTMKKILLLPAALVSTTVGISVAAFTLMSGLKLFAVLLPVLSAACPAIPAVIVGILAVALCVAMSFVMFRAFVGILQKSFSFAQLHKAVVNILKSLMTVRGLVKAAILVFAIFSLYFLCFLGLPTLTLAFGGAIALVVCVASLIGQLPFTILTVNTFCDLIVNSVVTGVKKIVNLFRGEQKSYSNNLTKRFENPSSDKGFFKRCTSFFGKRVAEPACLVFNAAGNGVLVVDPKSLTTCVAAGGNVLNSMAGNLVTDVGKAPERVQADEVIIKRHARLVPAPTARAINRPPASSPISIPGANKCRHVNEYSSLSSPSKRPSWKQQSSLNAATYTKAKSQIFIENKPSGMFSSDGNHRSLHR
ncbi:MAG: hypothetical protein REH83_06145 [Rickettsiella sp.]|nr:hypothetical protein [Rickettsiella sp.]